MTADKIKDILDNLGYKLTDKGKYWQTNAVFRQGDNHTALQIWKDTGVWRDYVTGTDYNNFRKLLEKHFADKGEINNLLEDKDFRYIEKRSSTAIETLESEKVYDEKLLNNLLPHYKFYNDRGISDSTLGFFKGGLATQGKMYQRFVFPIYNYYGQIHGFAGRDMISKEGRPKWKHIGQKRNWIYPFYLPPTSACSMPESINTTKEIILVESIGDALNLHENGIFNSMVTFGLDISPKQACHLVELNLERVIVSFNNDEDKADNRGLLGAIKTYLKLLDYLDPCKITICLPIKNDFGDMSPADFITWRSKVSSLDLKKLTLQIITFAQDSNKKKLISDNLYKNVGILEDYLASL